MHVRLTESDCSCYRINPAGLMQVGAFGDAGRDPRGWTVTVAFAALVPADIEGVKAAVRSTFVSHRALAYKPGCAPFISIETPWCLVAVLAPS